MWLGLLRMLWIPTSRSRGERCVFPLHIASSRGTRRSSTVGNTAGSRGQVTMLNVPCPGSSLVMPGSTQCKMSDPWSRGPSGHVFRVSSSSRSKKRGTPCLLGDHITHSDGASEGKSQGVVGSSREVVIRGFVSQESTPASA